MGLIKKKKKLLVVLSGLPAFSKRGKKRKKEKVSAGNVTENFLCLHIKKKIMRPGVHIENK